MKKFIAFLITSFIPMIALAAGNNTVVPATCLDKECKFGDLITLVNNLGNWSMVLVTTVATVLFVYAGFLYITAQGDIGQVKKATGVFRSVAIGFVIILASYLLVKEFLTKIQAPQALINVIK